MNGIRWMGAWVLGMAAASALWVSLARAAGAEEPKPELQSAVYFGGSGNQGAAQDGMGLAVSDTRLYLSGADLSLYGGQALAACYEIPAGGSPVWAFRWPNVKGNGWWNDESFPGIAVTEEGVYCAGRGWALVTDGVGGKETKAVLVKFPLTGATGPGAGGALWMAEPHFFPYTGIETFIGVTASREGGSTRLYATGRGQSDGSNNTAVLAKFDAAGSVLWKKVLGKAEYAEWSQGDSVVAHNGFIYVAGYTHWQGLKSWLGLKNPIRPHAGLWKLDPDGNVLWARESPQPVYQNSGALIQVAASGKFLYVACTREVGSDGVFTYDLLVLKYDEDGNLVWSKEWGGVKDEVSMGLAVTENRLYAVGYTTGWVGGGKDVFLAEMDPDSGDVLSAVHHGGKYDDVAYGVQVVGKDLYIVGDSKSTAQGGNAEGQSDAMILRYSLSAPVPILNVSIDIHPGSTPNPVNPGSKGKIPVAILSTADFRAAEVVDRASVTFGRTGDEKSQADSGCKPEDVNGDGLLDLVGHFETNLTGFLPGDVRGWLKGKTKKGQLFIGSDSVIIVPPKKEPAETPKRRVPPKEELKPAPPPSSRPKEIPPSPRGVEGAQSDGTVVY